jgi:hypothetical protein
LIISTIEEELEGDERFNERVEDEFSWFIFPNPKLRYSAEGLERLEFIVELWVVGQVEFTYMENGERRVLRHTVSKPQLLDRVVKKVPLRLLKLLSKGELEGDGCKITQVFEDGYWWMVEGEELYLPRRMLEWLLRLGEDPLGRLRDMGLMDGLMFKVVEHAWKGAEEAERDEGVEVDGRLKILREHGGEIHKLAEWADILGFKDKSGASKFFKRLEAEGLVKVERFEGGLKVEIAS